MTDPSLHTLFTQYLEAADAAHHNVEREQHDHALAKILGNAFQARIKPAHENGKFTAFGRAIEEAGADYAYYHQILSNLMENHIPLLPLDELLAQATHPIQSHRYTHEEAATFVIEALGRISPAIGTLARDALEHSSHVSAPLTPALVGQLAEHICTLIAIQLSATDTAIASPTVRQAFAALGQHLVFDVMAERATTPEEAESYRLHASLSQAFNLLTHVGYGEMVRDLFSAHQRKHTPPAPLSPEEIDRVVVPFKDTLAPLTLPTHRGASPSIRECWTHLPALFEENLMHAAAQAEAIVTASILHERLTSLPPQGRAILRDRLESSFRTATTAADYPAHAIMALLQEAGVDGRSHASVQQAMQHLFADYQAIVAERGNRPGHAPAAIQGGYGKAQIREKFGQTNTIAR